MNILKPSASPRLNEVTGLVFLVAGFFLLLSLVSYHPGDPSWNTATGLERAANWTGRFGSTVSDLIYSVVGLAAFCLPLLVGAAGVQRIRHRPIGAPAVRVAGVLLLLSGVCTLLSLFPGFRPFDGAVPAGGVAGLALASYLIENFNLGGAAILSVTAIFLSLYLVSRFSMELVYEWVEGPRDWWRDRLDRWRVWREQRQKARAARKLISKRRPEKPAVERRTASAEEAGIPVVPLDDQAPPWASKRTVQEVETEAQAGVEEEAQSKEEEEIPIRALEEPPWEKPLAPAPLEAESGRRRKERTGRAYVMPATSLLNEVPPRNPYDEQELKETAAKIKSKFEEFNVLGSVVQINPGPVVTTFEYKPDAGIKYNKITNLAEDLCLGLQCESVLIERIPGKPTVGIEVPNKRRELISLRQVLESEEFQGSASKLTITMGKDISGRIKVATLETMPHVLIAGSTGAGKSVMLNTLIMSLLYKATPEEVRLIMVDPKRVELGIYEGIPHLLTPVITEPKKATYALRNAVLEMERRLKLLAAQSVRNIEQYNRKVRQILSVPRSLFDQEAAIPDGEELRPLPFLVIIIDELADLMMLERAGVEESVTRLAQMARAVGIHLVLATQRPSVDVITGLIKANFPTRISFRVATRVDSRTILDNMGAHSLLGKGDMLFLPPGTARLLRVHGAYVSETETSMVVDYWKQQAEPDYDQSFLMAPPSEDGEMESEEEIVDGREDPQYRDAVRVVCELGKASTSVLQRRLRLGYGRAARILDMMHRDGIIGPPDGSRPREVLKSPSWLDEIDEQLG
ncbi:MAG: DNA translocase FtsK [Acidobacteriaceae bacterium]|nr:DNA translocase FtsK [Acidobacteriaceae bacterium]